MFLITIDGPSGSGKTTLAHQISDHLMAQGETVLTIHMDDLYEGWAEPLGEELAERLADILDGARRGATITIPQYKWADDAFGAPLFASTPQTLILEGVGSSQSLTREFASLSIWIEAPQEIALQRVLDRDGAELRSQMQSWQRREADHFIRESTKSAADYQVKSAP
jgi:uridine kinase